MICPKCGYDMGEEKVCTVCGFENEEVVEEELEENETEVNETETEVDYNSLEELKVDFDEVDDDTNEEDDEVLLDETDLNVDFNEIDMASQRKSRKKGMSSWLVALVSFIAGVLATLITIGCINGTLITCFDFITNGNPCEAVEKNLFASYVTYDAKDFTDSTSLYYRNSLIEYLQYYQSMGYEFDTDLEIDASDDKAFNKLAEYYLTQIVASEAEKASIENVKYLDVNFVKSGTDSFDTYLKTYKESNNEKVAKAEGVSAFAELVYNVDFKYESGTKESKLFKTTCVKVDNKWYYFQ